MKFNSINKTLLSLLATSLISGCASNNFMAGGYHFKNGKYDEESTEQAVNREDSVPLIERDSTFNKDSYRTIGIFPLR
ncbi:MAG: hypothetical protein AABX66_02590 [Nanoarchaeota archaeon]